METYLPFIIITSILFLGAILYKTNKNRRSDDYKPPVMPENPIIPDIRPSRRGDVNNGARFFSISVERFNTSTPVASRIQLLSSGNVLITSQTHNEIKTFIARDKWIYDDFPLEFSAKDYSFDAVKVYNTLGASQEVSGPISGTLYSSPVWSIEGNSVDLRTYNCEIYVNISAPEGYSVGVVVLNLVFEDLR